MEGLIESTMELFNTWDITGIMQFVTSILIPSLLVAFRKQLKAKLNAVIDKKAAEAENKINKEKLNDVKDEFKKFIKKTESKEDAIMKLLTTAFMNSNLDSSVKNKIIEIVDELKEGIESGEIDSGELQTMMETAKKAEDKKQASELEKLIQENEKIKNEKE